MADTNAPFTLRADYETRAKFAEICEQFSNKGAALHALIEAYELENAKRKLAGSADLIEDFRTHLEAINRAYIAQLDLNANTEQRLRVELSEETTGLTKSLAFAQEQAESAIKEAADARKEAERIQAEAEQAKEAAAAHAAGLEKRLEIAETAQKSAESAAIAKEQTTAVLEEQLTALRSQVESLQTAAAQVQTLHSALEETQNVLHEAEERHKSAESAASLALKQASLEKEQAILAAERLAAEKLEQMREKMEVLREERAALKDQIRDLTAERDTLQRKLLEFSEKFTQSVHSEVADADSSHLTQDEHSPFLPHQTQSEKQD